MNTSRNWATRAWSLAACALCVGFLFGRTAVHADNPHSAPAFGDVSVLAPVAAPFYPEGIAVNGNKVYIAGPATLYEGSEPSYVRAYDLKTGMLVRQYDIQGELIGVPGVPHANSCIAFDGQGRLYVVNIQLGIVRLDLGSGHQEIYAAPLPVQGPYNQRGPLPNDIAFDNAGNLYETDSFQATIWRIPPGGGQPQVWFQDPRLATPFGPNGIRINRSGTKLFFSVTAESVGPMGQFLGGKIYTLPLVRDPRSRDLKVFHQYEGDAPDGLAFGRNGDLYVMLAAPFNSGISILHPGGPEKARLSNAAPGLTQPYDSPANVAFDSNGSLLVTNHASLAGFPEHAAILSLFVGDTGLPLERPNLP